MRRTDGAGLRRRDFGAVARCLCALVALNMGVSACSGWLELEDVEELDPGPRLVDASFQRHQVKFPSGYRAEIAMALSNETDVPLLCVALGHNAAGDGLSGEDAIAQWLRRRRLELGGENLVADLAFAPVYDKTELDGVVAGCVEVWLSRAVVEGERINVAEPKRAFARF